MKYLPLLLVVAGCGPEYAVTRYTFDISVTAPDWVDETVVQGLQVDPCSNAILYDETLVVNSGYDAQAITAIRFYWSGFDVSGGGDNTFTWFLREGDTLPVTAVLNPGLLLYEIDDQGRMLEVDKDVANVRRKKTADVQYLVGEGLEITEAHKQTDKIEKIRLMQEGFGNCDSGY